MKYAIAYTPPTSIVSSRQDSLEINASLNYNAFNCITEIYNFSVTNYNTSGINWDIPFFIHLEGVEFFEWKAIGTGALNSTISGTTNIQHNHNGTPENHTQDVYLIEEIKVEQWKPSKQFLNTAHPKYGKKVNATSTINIGAQSTKYFWARFKTAFGSVKKFDISHLDPFVTAQLYRGGDGAGDFTSDINKTISEPINVTATIITIGIDTTAGSIERPVNEDLENNSIVNWINTASLQIDSITPINGSYSLATNNEPGADVITTRNMGNVSVNAKTFNISFNYRPKLSSLSPALKVAVIPATTALQGDPSIFLAQNVGTCTLTTGHFCYLDEGAGAWVDTGLAANNNSVSTIIIEVNLTKGGSTTDTRFNLYVNGTLAGGFDTVGSTPIQKFTSFGIDDDGGGGGNAIATIDDIEIYNGTSASSSTNVTTAGNTRSNQFTHTTTIRQFSYNSSETGGTDGLLFNFTCNGYEGTWSQGGGNNQTRPTENQFVACPVLGKSFAYETNLSQQQDLMQLNISTIDNTIPSINNTLWNQTVGFGVYTRVNVLNATVNVNEPDGDNYNVTFNWSRNDINLRFVNVSGSGGSATQFSDNLNTDTLRKGDIIRIDTFVQDSNSLDSHSGMKTNTTIIADFPVEFTRNPSFNFSQIFGQSNILVNLTILDQDPGDNITISLNFSKANSHNNLSNIIEPLVNLTTNTTGQVNFTLLTGNFSGGDNVSFRVYANSSAGNLGNFTSTIADWFIVKTNVNPVNITNLPATYKIDTSPFEINWTASRDSDASDTNITYRLEYANDGGDDFILINTSHPETNLTWSFRGLSIKYNTTYRFRVRSEFGINFTEYNITSNITLGENRTDINASTVSIYGNEQIIGRYGIGSNVTIQVNITPGLLTNISYVNFSLYSPNGSLINTTENASIASEGFLINSSHRFALRSGGTYTWKINASNTAGNETTLESIFTANGTFVVTDNYFVNPAQQLLKVIDPAERLTFNFTIYHSSVENITFNVSVRMDNSTAFNVSFQTITQEVNGSVHNSSTPALFVLNVNASGTSALRDEEYTGEINVTRVFDLNVTTIPIIFGVNPPRGEITMQSNGANPQAQCDSTINNCLFSIALEGGQQSTKTWRINNTGAFNLTGCGAHFYDAASGQNLTLTGINPVLSINGVDTTNPNNTSIRPNSTAILQLDIGPNMFVGTYTSNIDVNCRATRFGFTDAASANPNELPYATITVTPPTGTSGPTGGTGATPVTPTIVANATVPLFVGCGDNVCTTEREDIFSCRIDCAPDFDTLLTSVLSGDLFAQSRVTRVIAIALVVSLLAVYFRGQTPKPRKLQKSAFG